MACLIELRRSGETRRARAYNSNSFTTARQWRLSNNPAIFEAFVDDGVFDIFDSDRWLSRAKHARTFAGSRTHAAGKFREVIGLVQALERLFPSAVINEVVPLGNQIVNRAAVFGLTERHAAVHAARALCF